MANTFNNAQVQLTTTATTFIYQASSSTNAVSVVLSVLVANKNGLSSADISIIKASSTGTEQTRLAHTIPVPANTSLEIVASKLILKAGEKIQAQASSANYLDVTVSALEIV